MDGVTAPVAASRHLPVPPPEPFHAGGTGTPLVLLHGFTDTWRTWIPVLPELEKHHAVFAPSLPGHYGGPAITAGGPAMIKTSLDLIEQQLDERGIDAMHVINHLRPKLMALPVASACGDLKRRVRG